MPAFTRPNALDTFTTFGDLLRYLRRRAGLTQTELAIAVGYSHAQISRLEHNHRLPDLATIAARFVPALNLEDAPALVARLLELAASDSAAPVAGAGHAQPRHNLPLQLTSFIGRERQIAQVEQLLSAGRLVTLTGPGGVGKTRLACQVGVAVVNNFPDGVWLVELAPLSNPALVLHAIESMLRIRGESGFEALAEFLRPKSLLLILDNCEHLIAACAQLAEALLRTCPRLKILATSREGLGVAGELAFSVPSLALPALHEQPAVEALAQYEAVRLFVERAGSRLPGIQLDEETAPAIVQVCAQLDGLPLAIELAAAWVSILTVQQIAARLAEREQFRLLTAGRRTAVPRHQTLLALIGWSYELLAEAERRLLARLSAFSGGWTLEAAEAICADEDAQTLDGTEQTSELRESGAIYPANLLSLLAQLVNKSLVVAERGTSAVMRYQMLETIRQYASERLVASGEAERTRDRHFEYFWRWTERVEPELRGPRQLEWLSHLGAEHDNLRAALEWGLTRAEYGEASLRLASALLAFWYQRGHVSEGRAWLDRALTSPAGSDAGVVRAKALHAAGYLARIQGDTMTARTLLEASIDLWRALSPASQSGLAQALASLAEVLRRLGDPAAARSVASEGVALCRAQGERWGLAYSLSMLGMALRDQDDYALARSVITESVALWRALGDLWGLGLATTALGDVALREGEYTVAQGHYAECLEIARQFGDNQEAALALENLGIAAINLGDRGQAKTYFQESSNLFGALGNKAGQAVCLYYFGYLAHFEGDNQAAQTFFKQELALARTTGPIWLRSQALDGLAGVAAASGQPRRSARLLGAAETQLAAGASYVDAADVLYERHAEALIVAQIGEAAFAAARAEGKAMTFDQAVAYVLGSEDV